MPNAPDRKLGDIAMSYGDYRKNNQSNNNT